MNKASEKHAELDKVNLGKAVKTGAVSGFNNIFHKRNHICLQKQK